MKKPILPYKIGDCTDCGMKDKKLISKRCFDQPNFCYQKHQKEKYRAKQEVKKLIASKPRTKKESSINELLKLATIVFNRWIRNRDTIDGKFFICISSGLHLPVSQMDAGHFYPVSTSSALRFDEDNVHGQSRQENFYNPLHQVNYKKNIIQKIGVERFNALQARQHKEKKWSREELLEIIKKYKI